MRELLLQKGLDIKERDYFKDKFTEAEIRELAATVGVSEIFAWRSPSLKKMELVGKDLSESEMIQLMLQEPRLVRRPLVKVGDQLLVGANVKTMQAALDNLK